MAGEDGTDFGKIEMWVEGPEQVKYGEAFTLVMGGLSSKNASLAEKCRKALQDLAASIDAIAEAT